MTDIPIDEASIERLVRSDALDRLLDTARPVCDVMWSHPPQACMSEARFMIGFRCEVHGSDAHTVAVCSGHRSTLLSLIRELDKDGHAHRILFQELLK